MVCLSQVQDSPTRRRLLEVLALWPAIRHVRNKSRLPALREPVCRHQVSGLWRTECHWRLGGALPGTVKDLAERLRRLRRRIGTDGSIPYCPKISGSPFLLLPITTTLAFELLARLSVA